MRVRAGEGDRRALAGARGLQLRYATPAAEAASTARVRPRRLLRHERPMRRGDCCCFDRRFKDGKLRLQGPAPYGNLVHGTVRDGDLSGFPVANEKGAGGEVLLVHGGIESAKLAGESSLIFHRNAHLIKLEVLSQDSVTHHEVDFISFARL